MKPPKYARTSSRGSSPLVAPNTSTKIETFRPNNDIEYAPDEGSSLREITKQSRGESKDERSFQDITKHDHDGANSKEIDYRNLVGLFRTVAVAPTHTPTRFSEQVVFYYAGGTARIYFYDTINKAWRSVS